jgi:hypothetical protein
MGAETPGGRQDIFHFSTMEINERPESPPQF